MCDLLRLHKSSMHKIIILYFIVCLSKIGVRAEEKSILDDAVVLDSDNYIVESYLNVISNQRYKSFIHSLYGGEEEYD